MTIPDNIDQHLPTSVLVLIVLVDKVAGWTRSFRDQGRRLGRLRRDVDKIAADTGTKLGDPGGGDGS